MNPITRFDEKSYAEKMHNDQNFYNSFNLTELTIYAKWVKYIQLQKIGKDYDTVTDDELKEIEKKVKAVIIDFSEKHFLGFNPVVCFKEVNMAVEATRKNKLKIPYPLPITQKEWDAIQSVENENYRKVLFTMLVDAKYYRYFNSSLTKEVEINEDTVFYCQMDDNERFKVSKVKFKDKDEKRACFYTFYHQGLMGIKRGQKFYDYLTFVDISNENIIDYVTDYAHIDLHYKKLCGENITKCKQCGCLIKQNKYGNKLYCNEHKKGRENIGYKTRNCIDCGKEFFVPSRNNSKVRCDECQRALYLKKHRDIMRRKRNGDVTD